MDKGSLANLLDIAHRLFEARPEAPFGGPDPPLHAPPQLGPQPPRFPPIWQQQPEGAVQPLREHLLHPGGASAKKEASSEVGSSASGKKRFPRMHRV
jgi:hypothetical protein